MKVFIRVQKRYAIIFFKVKIERAKHVACSINQLPFVRWAGGVFYKAAVQGVKQIPVCFMPAVAHKVVVTIVVVIIAAVIFRLVQACTVAKTKLVNPLFAFKPLHYKRVTFVLVFNNCSNPKVVAF